MPWRHAGLSPKLKYLNFRICCDLCLKSCRLHSELARNVSLYHRFALHLLIDFVCNPVARNASVALGENVA